MTRVMDVFKEWDADGNGQISVLEFRAARHLDLPLDLRRSRRSFRCSTPTARSLGVRRRANRALRRRPPRRIDESEEAKAARAEAAAAKAAAEEAAEAEAAREAAAAALPSERLAAAAAALDAPDAAKSGRRRSPSRTSRCASSTAPPVG